MDNNAIVAQITEIEALLDEAPITNALRLELIGKLNNIKECILTESLKEDLQRVINREPEKKHEFLDEDGDDLINHPTHYQSFVSGLNIEAIDCMRAAFGDEDVKSFCICNALKYIFRCYSKGKNTDVGKAQWYLSKFMELGGFD